MIFEEIDEDNSNEVKQFDDIFTIITQKCDKSDSLDRCDRALEFAECFDNVMESFDIGNGLSWSDDVDE